MQGFQGLTAPKAMSVVNTVAINFCYCVVRYEASHAVGWDPISYAILYMASASHGGLAFGFTLMPSESVDFLMLFTLLRWLQSKKPP